VRLGDAMTNDEIWHQSTVMERCEILRAQVHRLMKANAWVHPDSEPMGPPTVVQLRPGGVITGDEIVRLKRIEAAAERVVESWRGMYGVPDWTDLRALRKALRS